MNVDYILRKDIDRFKIFLDELEALMQEKGIDSNDIEELLSQYCDMQTLELVRDELMSMITQYEPSNTFSLSNFKEVDGFVSSGVTVKVYSDGLSVFVTFNGTAKITANGNKVIGSINSAYAPSSDYVYSHLTHTSLDILGAVYNGGGVFIINKSSATSTPVYGAIYYPLKERITNVDGETTLTAVDMSQYYKSSIIDGLLALKSDNTDTLTDIELLNDGKINLKYIGDK